MPSIRTLFANPTAQQVYDAPDSVFRRFVNKRHNLDLKDYHELHKWTVQQQNLNTFWEDIYDFCDVIGEKESPLFDPSYPMDTPNPNLIRAKLNLAENLLLAHPNARSTTEPAVIALIEPDSTLTPGTKEYLDSTHSRTLTFEELYQEVNKLATALKEMGIQPGDRVVAFSPSNAEAIVMCIATTVLGGVWSSCPSEFGVKAVLERFTQIQPKVILSADFYRYNGKKLDVLPKLLQILEQLPEVKNVVMVGQLSADRKPRIEFPRDRKGRIWEAYSEVIARGAKIAPKEISFRRGSAMDPVYVLYSSGTTGKPKAIVHSVGGMVLSLAMTNTLHAGYGPNDRMLQFSTLGWMMWNFALSTMAKGTTVCAYDGSPLNPTNILWSLTEKYHVTTLGVSPRYLQSMESAKYIPKDNHKLTSLHTIATAGSVLKADLYDWVRENVGEKIFINNGTGGTDICNLFVGSARSLPTFHAEIQVPGLGMDLQSWDDDGRAQFDVSGEMVITKPFPNMPLCFWGDQANKRYKAAYFEAWKTPVWTQGDWIEISSLTGGVTVFGRSDGVLNPAGVRFGSAELYSVVEELRESVEDCIAVAQKIPPALEDERVVLFVKPKRGNLTAELINEIKSAIRQNLSTRHVPAKFIQCDKIPYTGNGKRLEIPVKKLINGIKFESLNLSSAEDPECLRFFVNHPELKFDQKAKL